MSGTIHLRQLDDISNDDCNIFTIECGRTAETKFDLNAYEKFVCLYDCMYVWFFFFNFAFTTMCIHVCYKITYSTERQHRRYRMWRTIKRAKSIRRQAVNNPLSNLMWFIFVVVFFFALGLVSFYGQTMASIFFCMNKMQSFTIVMYLQVMVCSDHHTYMTRLDCFVINAIGSIG